MYLKNIEPLDFPLIYETTVEAQQEGERGADAKSRQVITTIIRQGKEAHGLEPYLTT